MDTPGIMLSGLILPRALGLFVITAVAEILGCWLPYLWLREGRSAWLLLPAAVSLATFAWLLTLHPTSGARTYAAYGGVYIAVAIVWLWLVEGRVPNRWDVVGRWRWGGARRNGDHRRGKLVVVLSAVPARTLRAYGDRRIR